MMIIRRLFSLDSGSYSGGKREPSRSGSGLVGRAVIGGLIGAAIGGLQATAEKARAIIMGGLIGAGLGVVTKWLSNIADQSEFNRGRSSDYNSYSFFRYLDSYFGEDQPEDAETTTSTSSSETDETGRTVSRTVTKKTVARSKREVEGIRYSVDGDPKKHVVSILFSGNSAALYINRANSGEIRTIDLVLDKYCREYKNADYISEKISSGTYFVDVKLISGYEFLIGILLINSGIKLNILTGQRFGVNKR